MNFEILKTPLKGALEIRAKMFTDNRGGMLRIYDESLFKKAGLNTLWTQDSLSRTSKAGTLRGLHFQTPPYSEQKLIQVISGKMLWVSVDIRKNSETFGKHIAVKLDAENPSSLYVEKGFAHGCLSLSENTDLMIKSDSYFMTGHGGGIRWDDKDLNIPWNCTNPLISEAHASYPSFKDFLKNYGAIEV